MLYVPISVCGCNLDFFICFLKFMLEDARRSDKDSENVQENITRWAASQSSPNEPTDTATVTLPLRKPNKFPDDGGKLNLVV